MKKLVSVLISVCLALLMTVPAFADTDGPRFLDYDIECRKETPYYDYSGGVMEKKGTIPAGTVLTVTYEYEKEGVLYGSVNVGDEENSDWFYIRLSDVEMKSDKYLPKDEQKLAVPRTVQVIEKKGITLYSGPSKKYTALATVPQGTKLTYTYGNDSSDSYRTWAYTNYLDQSGWIYVDAADTKNGLVELPYADDKAEILVLDDNVKMFSGMSFGNVEDELNKDWKDDVKKEWHEAPDKVVGTLKKGEKYTYQYYHGQSFGTWYYVSSGAQSGWVFMSEDISRVAATPKYNERNRFMTFKDVNLKLYQTPKEGSKAVTVNVAKNTEMKPEYIAHSEYNSYYYQTVGGQTGWYSREDIEKSAAYRWHYDSDVTEEEYEKNNTKIAAPIYSDIITKDNKVGEIPAGSRFAPLYDGGYYEENSDSGEEEWESFFYVSFNGVTGWVDRSDLWSEDADPDGDEDETTTAEVTEVTDAETTTEDAEETTEAVIEEESAENETEPENSDADVVSKGGLSPTQIVLVCVAGAVVLALTAAVTLVLIRRKREGDNVLPGETEEDIDEDINDPEDDSEE